MFYCPSLTRSSSVRVLNEKEWERRAPRAGRGAVGAEFERRRREDRGAEGSEEVECGEGPRPLPTVGGVWGGGCVPSPEKNVISALNMVSFGAFWMVLFTVQLPVLHAKSEFKRYRRIKAVMVSR